jgi:hypothetical protein
MSPEEMEMEARIELLQEQVNRIIEHLNFAAGMLSHVVPLDAAAALSRNALMLRTGRMPSR